MMSEPEKTDVQKLFGLIEPIEYAMLVTQTADGSLRSRPMTVRTGSDDDNLWFMTDKDSAKVIEVSEAKQVNVSFADPEARVFVSVSGIATVENNDAMLEKLWNPEAQVWFPHGKNDPRLTLLKVQPTHAEYWDAPRGVFVELYELTRSIISGERPEADFVDNKKIDW